jgi:hypothetical protein
MTISRPRRSPEAALNDIAEKFEGTAERLRCYSPAVNPDNPNWNQTLSIIETLLKNRVGERFEKAGNQSINMDLGSASFPLSVIEASKSAVEGIPSLVVGTDFDGLYIAAAIMPISEGVI